MKNKGLFINIEGIDGSGKSSIAKKICSYYESIGKPLLYLNRKDTNFNTLYLCEHMSSISDILWSNGAVFKKGPENRIQVIPLEHWFFLTLAWYKMFECKKVLPLLNDGKNVITDGYFYKELVKFKKGGLKKDYLKLFNDLRKPDINILIDTTPEVSLSTKSNISIVECGKFDGLQGDESENYILHQKELRYIYQQIANKNKWCIVKRRDVLFKDTSNEIFYLIKEIIENKWR